MTDLDQIRSEIATELQAVDAESLDAVVAGVEVSDAELDLALAELGLSDVAIELLVAAADPAALRDDLARESVERVSQVVPTPVPDVSAARGQHRLSVVQAREMLGDVAQRLFDELDRGPGLRWLGVAPRLAGIYLDSVGIDRASFARALGSAVSAYGGEHPWGYRPGAVADAPVEFASGTPVADEARDWIAEFLPRDEPVEPAEASELLGYRWSPQQVAREAAGLQRRLRWSLLREPMRTEREIDWQRLLADPEAVLILLTDYGRRVPAFQFEPGTSAALKPLVAETNRRLGAANDPWAVASWWFSPSAQLGERPVDALAANDAGERLRAAVDFLLTDPS